MSIFKVLRYLTSCGVRNIAAAAFVAASFGAARADQSSIVTPIVGPHTMSDFTTNYLNPALRALLSNSSGTAAPANGPSGAPATYQWWADTSTSPPTLRIYDSAQWIAVGTVNGSTHTFSATPSTSSTYGGVLSVAAVTHQFLTSVVAGVPVAAQPVFGDIGGTLASGQANSLGGDFSCSGLTCTIGANAVSNSKAAPMAAGTVKSNITGSTAPPADNSLTSIIDAAFGSTQGSEICRTSSGWQLTAGGATGTVKTGNGTNTCGTYQAAGAATAIVGFRNRIIDGGMQIDQRNVGAAQTIAAGAALAYTVDRFYAYSTGANVAGQRVAGSAGSQFRYQLTGASGVTAIGFGQRIEASGSLDLAGQTATLGVDLADSTLTTVTWTAYYANTTDTFGSLASPTKTQIATGTFPVSSTLARYTTAITIPSAATTGIEVVLSVGAQTSGTLTIGNVQLEPGSVATAFERRPLSAELQMALWYYRKSYAGNVKPGTNVGVGLGQFYLVTASAGSGYIGTYLVYGGPMRVTPALITYDNSGASGFITYQSTASWTNGGARTINTSTSSGFTITVGPVSGLTNLSFDYTADAEL